MYVTALFNDLLTMQRKGVVLFFLYLSSLTAAAQAYPTYEHDHEVKLNVGLFLATSTVEVSYEYFFAEDISIGGTLYADGDPTDFNGGFGIGPNLRAYFGFAPRRGFFAEVFILYYTGEDEVEESSLPNPMPTIDFGAAALGLGAGYKWVTPSDRFTLELSAGAGRNFSTPDSRSSFTYRGGLSVGYRF